MTSDDFTGRGSPFSPCWGEIQVSQSPRGDYLVPVNADVPNMDVIFVGEADPFKFCIYTFQRPPSLHARLSLQLACCFAPGARRRWIIRLGDCDNVSDTQLHL